MQQTSNEVRELDINGNNTQKTPVKPISDTTKRRAYKFDTQKHGKPDYSIVNIEEFRTKLKDEDIEELEQADLDKEFKKDKVELLRNPGTADTENTHIASFGMKNEHMKDLNGLRPSLIELASSARMDVIVTPAILGGNPKKTIRSIKQQYEFWKVYTDQYTKLAISLDITETTIPDLQEIVQWIEENIPEEDMPIIGVRGFNPFSHAASFFALREFTDRHLMVTNVNKRIRHERWDEHGTLSAEQLLAHMGADIIGQYFHIGGYSTDEEDSDPREQREWLLEPGTGVYRKLNWEEAARFINCETCFIHQIKEPGIALEYFVNQNKGFDASRLHNEMTCIREINKIRESMTEEEHDGFLSDQRQMEEAIETLTDQG